MKRIFMACVLTLIFVYSGCNSKGLALSGSEEITMSNIDNYLEKDARYIDLRNFSDQLNSGFIKGFELIPFFQFLEGRALVRNNKWEFSSDDILSELTLENIFGDKSKIIFLMCGSGTRASYVKSALDELGYKKVFNIGGIKDYEGNNKILGDGEFNGNSQLPKLVDMSNIDKFMDRHNAKYVDLRNVKDKYVSGYIDGFENVSFFEYLDNRALKRNSAWEFTKVDILSKSILENIFGDKKREIFLMCGSGTRAGYIKAALEEVGYETIHNVGGIKDYEGKRKILGDSEFTLTVK